MSGLGMSGSSHLFKVNVVYFPYIKCQYHIYYFAHIPGLRRGKPTCY